MGKSQNQVRIDFDADLSDDIDERDLLDFNFDDEPLVEHSDLEEAKLRATRRRSKNKKLPNDWQDFELNDWQDYDIEDLEDDSP